MASCCLSRTAVALRPRSCTLLARRPGPSALDLLAFGPRPCARRLHVRATRQQQTARICASAAPADDDDLIEVDLRVDGMECEACAKGVTEALKKNKAVVKVDVALKEGIATIKVSSPTMYDALELLPKLVDAVKAAGFVATPMLEG